MYNILKNNNLVSESLILLLINIISKFFLFFFIVILTKVLSKNEIGSFFYILNVQTIILLLSHMGIQTLILRTLPNLINYAKEKIFSFILFCLLFIILTTTAYSLIAVNFLNFNINNSYIIIFFFLITSINSILSTILQGHQKVIKSLFIEFFLKNILVLLIAIIFLFLNEVIDINHVLIFFVIANLIVFFLLFYFIFKKIEIFNYNNYFELKKNIYSIFVVGIGTIFVSINSRLDIFFIEYFLNKSSVADYSIAIQILSFFLLPSQAIVAILYPKISKLISLQKEKLLNLQVNFARFLLLVYNIFVFILSIFFLNYALQIFFPNFVNSYYVILVLVFGNIMCSIFVFSDIILNMKKKEKKVTISFFFGVVLNCLLNFLLIPILGIIGASIATIISQFLIYAIIFIFLIKDNKSVLLFNTKKIFLKKNVFFKIYKIFR